MPRPALEVLQGGRDRVEVLQCNMCPTRRQTGPAQTFEELQEKLRLQGWLCKDGVDVCPPCRAALRG